MFSSTVPFSLRERTCKILVYPWMGFDSHERNRTEILPGIVGSSIEGTIRLQSDFEVRCSSLFKLYYIYLFDIFDSWLAIRAQLALGNPTHVSHHSFHMEYSSLNRWISSQPRADD